MNTFLMKWVIGLVIIIVLGVVAFMLLPAPAAAPAGGAPVVGVGEHCGGFIKDAPVCTTGLHCQLTVNMPDTGGVCVAD